MKNTNNLNSGHFYFGIKGLFISKLNLRCYSTQNTPVVPNLVPIRTYNNSDLDKLDILKENKGKSGVYQWENSINNKRYIGSSENLNRRFSEYFNVNYLLKNYSMAICCALLKYGYTNFSLIILEYCEPSKCLIREKHYWDLFNPEYNIAKDPTAPMSGRKHLDETKKILSDSNKGSNNPFFGKNHSDEVRKIISEAKLGEKHPRFGKNHSEETLKKMSIAQMGNSNARH